MMMRRAKRVHPAEGRLRAWLDGELGAWAALRVRVHLWRCAPCRDRAAAAGARSARIEALLDPLAVEVNAAEAWARLGVRSGREARGRGREWAWAGGGLAAAAAALALWLGGPRSDGESPDLTSGLPRLAVEPGREAGEGFLRWIADWNGVRVARDVCCLDLDGGGRADDGVFTLSDPDERVAMVIVYEDTDGRGELGPGSLVRYIGRSP